jgi:hypothetical protein
MPFDRGGLERVDGFVETFARHGDAVPGVRRSETQFVLARTRDAGTESVADHYEEMAERGAKQRGEGRLP